MKKVIILVSGFAATVISAPAWASPVSTGLQRAASVESVTPAQETADKLLYGRLGQGMGIAGGLHGGPMLGLGLRLELNRIGLDASMSFGITQVTRNMEITGMRGSWLKLVPQVFLMPQADATPYLGAGLSWGGQKERIDGITYSGSGLQGEIVLGYEFLRSSTIRLFVQADATLPMYRAVADQVPERLAIGKAANSYQVQQRYLPTVGLSLGIAWGRPRVIRVETPPDPSATTRASCPSRR